MHACSNARGNFEADTFASKVITDSIKLQYSDTTWYAKAKCRGTLQGKDITITLYLNVENREEDLFKWVIAKAEGEVLELNAKKKHTPYMLMPDEHEINYMALSRITRETAEYVKDYKTKKYVIDQTTAFFTLVKMGLLKIKYVEDLTFMFFQVPGYVFSVKNIEREDPNAGWLITSFGRLSEEEKRNFLTWLHN